MVYRTIWLSLLAMLSTSTLGQFQNTYSRPPTPGRNTFTSFGNLPAVYQPYNAPPEKSQYTSNFGRPQFSSPPFGSHEFRSPYIGPSQFGSSPSGPGQFDLIPSGSRQFGSMSPGPRQFGPMSSAPQQFTSMSPGSRQFGSTFSGPQQFGPMSSGRQQFGPMSSGRQQFGPVPSGPQKFGPVRPVPQNFGPVPPAPQNFGPVLPALQNFGPVPPVPQNFSPISSVPQKFGSASSGRQHFDSMSSDPQKFNSTHSGPPGASVPPSDNSQTAVSTSGNSQNGASSSGTVQTDASSSGSSQSDASSSGSSQSHASSSGSSQSDASSSASSKSGSPSPNSNTAHASAHSSRDDGDALEEYRIVCLFNNKHFYRGGFTPALIDPKICTHLNYEFAILDPKSYEMIPGLTELDIQENFYQEAIDLRKWNPKLKVLLSLGGWADSTEKYSLMADDPSKRKNFIEKAVEFLKTHEFDGMDLAWEYPNCWQGAIGVNPKDKDNFLSLVQELKAAFKPKGLILSASVGAIKREIEAAYDVPGISDAFDYLNVMTFDMHGPWETVTGHHLQFEKMSADSDPYCNVKAALDFWTEKGADRKKLNLGLAFYGKSFTLADETNNGMGAAAKSIGKPGPDSDEGGFLLYNEICQFLNEGNWTEKEDKQAGFYAYSGDQWACYDPPMMVVRKAKYVVDSGLGGLLLKDLSGDDYKGLCFSLPFPLTKMARLEMIQRIKKKHH